MRRGSLSRGANGAVAGALAALVWALQQPLDKRVGGSAMTTSSCSASSSPRGRAGRPSGSPFTSRTVRHSAPATRSWRPHCRVGPGPVASAARWSRTSGSGRWSGSPIGSTRPVASWSGWPETAARSPRRPGATRSSGSSSASPRRASTRSYSGPRCQSGSGLPRRAITRSAGQRIAAARGRRGP